MSPPGYQAPVIKASRCGNERQEMSDRSKAGRKGSGKKTLGAQFSHKPYGHLSGLRLKKLVSCCFSKFKSVKKFLFFCCCWTLNDQSQVCQKTNFKPAPAQKEGPKILGFKILKFPILSSLFLSLSLTHTHHTDTLAHK